MRSKIVWWLYAATVFQALFVAANAQSWTALKSSLNMGPSDLASACYLTVGFPGVMGSRFAYSNANSKKWEDYLKAVLEAEDKPHIGALSRSLRYLSRAIYTDSQSRPVLVMQEDDRVDMLKDLMHEAASRRKSSKQEITLRKVVFIYLIFGGTESQREKEALMKQVKVDRIEVYKNVQQILRNLRLVRTAVPGMNRPYPIR